jgi:hypothetical protein
VRVCVRVRVRVRVCVRVRVRVRVYSSVPCKRLQLYVRALRKLVTNSITNLTQGARLRCTP